MSRANSSGKRPVFEEGKTFVARTRDVRIIRDLICEPEDVLDFFDRYVEEESMEIHVEIAQEAVRAGIDPQEIEELFREVVTTEAIEAERLRSPVDAEAKIDD
ncbi:hypothetical protein OROHE_009211 [Orobanche hederae]